MNMQERIARSIYERRNGKGCTPWSRLPNSHRAPYLSDADAALDSLMAPTPGMKAAAARSVGNYDLAHDGFVQAIVAAKEGN